MVPANENDSQCEERVNEGNPGGSDAKVHGLHDTRTQEKKEGIIVTASHCRAGGKERLMSRQVKPDRQDDCPQGTPKQDVLDGFHRGIDGCKMIVFFLFHV